MALTTEVEQKIDVPAWFGTADELLALVSTIEGWFETERSAHASQLPKPTPRYSGSERAKFAAGWTASVSAKNSRGHTVKGSLEEVLATNETVPLTEIRYTYPSWGASTKSQVILMGDVKDGVRLYITSDNQYRIEALKAVVAGETKKNRPWWTWFLTTKSGAVTEYATLVLAFYGLTLLLGRNADNNVVVALLIALGSIVGPTIFWLTRWRRLTPLFELLSRRDQTPKAYKLLRWVAGVMGTVAVGLVVAFAAR